MLLKARKAVFKQVTWHFMTTCEVGISIPMIMAVESGQEVFWGQKVGLVAASVATVSLAQQPSSCAQPSKEQAQKRFFSGFSNY